MQKVLQNESMHSETATSRRRLLCPLCDKHTVLWLLPDTEIKNLPIKCKRCGRESIVNVQPLTEA